MTTSTMPSVMRALVLAEYGRMSVDERSVPLPGAGDVLLQVLYTGICGTDIHGFTGENGRRSPGQVMGHESVARLAALGGDPVPGVNIGDLVTFNPTISCAHCSTCHSGRGYICAERRVIGVDPAISSGFGEYMSVPMGNVVRLPDGMPAEHGALIEPLAVGYHAARRAGVASGDRVLVVGAGPIGQAVALAAERLGASRVVVSEPSSTRRKLVQELGFDSIDPITDEQLTRSLGSGVNIAIDAVGSSVTLNSALQAVNPGGVVVLVGMNEPRLDVGSFAISTQERDIRGAFCYSRSEFQETAEWAAQSGSLLDRLISGVVSLDQAPDSFNELAASTEGASKILVRLDA